MNLQILKWLVSHRDVLGQVLDAVKGWNNDLTSIQKWEVVDKVARLVIPILTEEDIIHLSSYDWQAPDIVESMAVGAEYAALGMDWQTLLKVLLPILQVILDALAKNV
jgi:hypothetical protein